MALRAISQQKISARRYNILNSIYTGNADPYFEYTTLLLPGNGNSGAFNHQFLDSGTANSGSGFPITRNGNATQGTFSPFSQTGWGNYFDGSSYLSLADNAAFTLGTNNFTIECWVYNGTTGVRQFLAGQTNSAGANTATSFAIRKTNTNKLSCSVCFSSTDYAATSTNDLPLNSWVHIAFVRDGNTLRQYINGVQDGTASVTGVTVNDSSNQLAIGRLGEVTSDYWYGYISNFRFVNGRCVYPSGTTFDPPTSPLTRTTGGTNPPQGTECSLLTCQSNRFLDSNGVNIPASSPLTITVNGSPSVQAFSPFNPSASWSAATYGGSGYFDGNGDWLTIAEATPLQLNSTAFSIELWLYPSSVSANRMIIGKRDTNGGSGYAMSWYIQGNSNGGFIFYSANGSLTSNNNVLIANAWNHIAVTSDGTNVSMYANGSRVNTPTALAVGNSASSIYIGNFPVDNLYYQGNFADVRIQKGAQTYTGTTYTVPTAPLARDANTSLLLNFTNAGIYDATSKNDLETVGNAQISTAQSKWGGSSMAFDGSGDYLISSNTNMYTLYGAFTIEGWVYRNTSSSRLIFIEARTAGGYANYLFGILTNGTAEFVTSNSANYYNPSETVTSGQWVHVALVRDTSNVVKLYINGNGAATTKTISGVLTPAASSVWIGGQKDPQYSDGYINDLRITQLARYTTNFTAPTAAFPTL